jgi:hypothetical protein
VTIINWNALAETDPDTVGAFAAAVSRSFVLVKEGLSGRGTRSTSTGLPDEALVVSPQRTQRTDSDPAFSNDEGSG